MALELNGTTGVSLVQDGVVTTADLASGAITSAALPTGSVLQVVQNTHSTTATSTSTTYSNTGLNVSITPSSASSKILLIIFNTLGGDVDNDSGGTVEGKLKLLRTVNGSDTQVYNDEGFMSARGGQHHSNQYPPILDSPATTSAVTYTLQFARQSGSVGFVSNQANRSARIIAMEIAG